MPRIHHISRYNAGSNEECLSVAPLLVKFSILKTIFGILLSDEWDDFDAPLWDFDHPHDIHHIQNNTRRDPGKLDYTSQSHEGLCSKHLIEEEIGWWHGSNPHEEEHHSHEYPVDDISFTKLRVP